KTEWLPVRADLAEELRRHVAEPGQSDGLLLRDLMPTMSKHRRLLELAEVEFVDARGRRADFHALRHTYCTNVHRAGARQRELMALMRHSDRKLSDHVYLDTNLLPLAGIVEALPDFSPIQIATQRSVSEEPVLAQQDGNGSGTTKGQVVHLQGKMH